MVPVNEGPFRMSRFFRCTQLLMQSSNEPDKDVSESTMLFSLLSSHMLGIGPHKAGFSDMSKDSRLKSCAKHGGSVDDMFVLRNSSFESCVKPHSVDGMPPRMVFRATVVELESSKCSRRWRLLSVSGSVPSRWLSAKDIDMT